MPFINVFRLKVSKGLVMEIENVALQQGCFLSGFNRTCFDACSPGTRKRNPLRGEKVNENFAAHAQAADHHHGRG